MTSQKIQVKNNPAEMKPRSFPVCFIQSSCTKADGALKKAVGKE